MGLIKRNQSRRQVTEVPEEHQICSDVAAGVCTFFPQVIVVRSNAAREAELDFTVSVSHVIPFLLLQVILEELIFVSLN